MQILSQQDPKWAAVFLGNSKLTVGRYGCTTTCISMVSDYFGCFKDPGQIAKPENGILKYTDDNHAQGGGLVLWDTLNLVTPDGKKLVREKRLYGRHDDEILISLKDPNKAVAVQVNGVHWVLVTNTFDEDTYCIVDPWHGDRANTDRYKGNITGSVHFIKK